MGGEEEHSKDDEDDDVFRFCFSGGPSSSALRRRRHRISSHPSPSSGAAHPLIASHFIPAFAAARGDVPAGGSQRGKRQKMIVKLSGIAPSHHHHRSTTPATIPLTTTRAQARDDQIFGSGSPPVGLLQRVEYVVDNAEEVLPALEGEGVAPRLQ